MSDALLTVFRLLFLALVWLFFLQIARSVLRVGAGGDGTPIPLDPRPPRKRTRSRREPAMVIVEPLDQAGLVFPVSEQLTIGRAASCDLTLDDTFVSSHHARIARTGDDLIVSDLGSTNGTYVDRQRVTTPRPLARGSRVQVGSTVLEVR